MHVMRPRTYCLSMMVTLLLLHSATKVLHAAPHAEITVMPLGNLTVRNGLQQLTISLPRYRPLPPLVLASVQPSVQPLAAAGGDEDDANNAAPAIQVPATIKFKVNGRALPDWVLAPTPAAYVISPETLRGNAGFAEDVLRIEAHLVSEATEAFVAKLAMPDPMLLAENGKLALDGPLTEFQRRAAGKPQVARYFAAQASEFAGDLEAARSEYEALANADHAQVARFARRGLRLLNYRLRERTVSGNFLEHYRWGHYLRMAGLYGMAHEEFAECMLLNPKHFGGQYYAGATMAMLPRSLIDWMLFFDQAGLAIEDQVTTKARINVAVAIVKSRNGASLTESQINAVKDAFICVDRLLNVASRGRLEIVSHWHMIDDAESDQLALTAGGVLAPKSGLIRSDGWFDVVVTVLPRLTGEARYEVVVAGGDASTSNAMVANVFHDGGLNATAMIYHRILRRLSAHAPVLAALPHADSLNRYGLQPSGNVHTSVWSTVHDLCPTQALVGVQVAQPVVDDSYLQLWNVMPLDAATLDACRKAFDADPLPVRGPGKDVIIDNHDLRLTPHSQGATAGFLASTWVYLPSSGGVQTRFDLHSIDSLRLRCNGLAIYGEHTADQVGRSSFLRLNLKTGWNLLEVLAVTKANDKASMALSILDWKNEPIPGLACAFRAPSDFVYQPHTSATVGKHYQWTDVRNDWRNLLPNLTGLPLPEFESWQIASDGSNYVGLFADSQSATRGYRSAAGLDADDFRDVQLNNVIDWRREWCGVIQGSDGRQLLLVRPEGAPSTVYCLKEADSLPARLQGKTVGQRLLGYVEVDLHDSRQPLFIFDVALGSPASWPTDEEGLLTPFGPYVPNEVFFPPAQGPVPPVSN